MAALSDQLLVFTILGYLIAMISHAASYAFSGRGAVAAISRPARQLVTVGAGESDAPLAKVDAPPAGTSTGRVPPKSTGRAAIAARIAMVATMLATALHLGALVTRGVAAERLPWGNMYEFLLSVTFVGAAGWLYLLFRWPSVRQLGLVLTMVMVVLLGIAGLVLYTPVVPLVPALNSYWFDIHVTTISFSSGILLLAFVPALMYLLRAGYESGKRSFPYVLARRAPSAVTLERLTFGLNAFAFPIFTFAVIAGAVWAEAAWGRAWGWDPKETWAFISWVVYAGYLHARATPSVKRNVVTWISILGFLTMLMNLFGVNFFFTGLHSYAGVN
ncbi:c-type cytochrome biogenesis protein CcsB [Micromonospora sp. NBC_01699]|uniref:c-type cytochrome biogenesis protein CcsB n=1 Tax=Micromonospora sp. NBC_01699 TaxID=2975984 RepID=UPI002E2D85C0|nr:c-type cytochrome biogenesis protein CcsB [Micromonospora sp. NBC_01699]